MGRVKTKPAAAARLKTILVDYIGVDKKKITPKAMMKDFDIDPDNLLELAMEIEDQFGIKISDARWAELSAGSFTDLIDWVYANH